MAEIILVTGGCRSGKSDYAQKLAESRPGRRVYVATCPIIDEEMRSRVEAHRLARADCGWDTIEQPIDLPAAIDAADHDVLLIDCLTLWVNNLMHQADQAGSDFTEDDVRKSAGELLAACRAHSGAVVMVTNEVGMGIVPDNALARRYRDLVGRVNQIIAAEADVVTLVSCGIPLQLKA